MKNTVLAPAALALMTALVSCGPSAKDTEESRLPAVPSGTGTVPASPPATEQGGAPAVEAPQSTPPEATPPEATPPEASPPAGEVPAVPQAPGGMANLPPAGGAGPTGGALPVAMGGGVGTAGMGGSGGGPMAGAMAMANGGAGAPGGAGGGQSSGGAGGMAVAGAGGMAAGGEVMLTAPWAHVETCSDGDRDSCGDIPVPFRRPRIGGPDNVPPLSWTPGPAETKSYVLVFYDVSADITHWALWNMPAETLSYGPEAMPPGALSGSFDKPEWAGPGSCKNVYQLTLYALSVEEYMPGGDFKSVRTGLEGDDAGLVLSKDVIMGAPLAPCG